MHEYYYVLLMTQYTPGGANCEHANDVPTHALSSHLSCHVTAVPLHPNSAVSPLRLIQ
jgi:hypothetical protein